MATIQKSTKINFYKFVQVKEPSSSAVRSDDTVLLTKTLNKNIEATNRLGSTLNSFAKILSDIKASQLAMLNAAQKDRIKDSFTANYTKVKKRREQSGSTLMDAFQTPSFLEGLFNFLGGLLKVAIIIPALQWLSDPENREKVEKVVDIIGKVVKFIFDVAKFGVTNTIEGLYNLLKDDATWQERLLGLGQTLVGIGTIVLGVRYLKNPTRIITDIVGGIRALINFVNGRRGVPGGGRRGGLKGVLKQALPVAAVTTTAVSAEMLRRRSRETTEQQIEEKGLTEATPKEQADELSKPGSMAETFTRMILPSLNRMMGGVVPQAAQGGWISGPQSGYPVSLDGGRSTSFIGHGTEYVARKSNGGAFVVPFDTPGTKTQPHLTQRRLGEGKRLGFFANGGLVGSNAEKWAHMRNLGSKAGAKYPNLVAAQFALESAWGSAISGKNNFFGIKATGNEPATVKNTREVINGKSIYVDARFKDFQTPQDAVNHLVTQWYKDYRGYSGVNNAPDVLAAADMLKTEGYATDPAYAQSLKRLLGEYSDTDARPSNKGTFMQQFMRFFGVGGGGDEHDERGGNEGGRTVKSGSNTVIGVTHPDTGSGYGIKGQTDQSGRPLTFSKPAATAFSRALKDSGMDLGSFIASTGRSDAKNKSVGGHPNSHHMYGEAIDMNGAGYEWMKANGKKYGWQYVYNHGPGSAHFKYVGSGAGSTPKLGPPGQKPTVTAAPTQQESAKNDTGMVRSLLGSPSSSKGLSIGRGGNPASKFKSAQEKRELEKTTDERNKARREVTSRSQEMIQTALATIAQQNGVNSQAIQQAQMAIQAAMSQTPKTPMVVGAGGRAGGFGGGGSAGSGSGGGGKSTASKLSSSLNTLRGILK
tara:strand:+ start:6787 stop:9402 length:2616 start_codon:yes stop_codon:yes gene_type:complete